MAKNRNLAVPPGSTNGIWELKYWLKGYFREVNLTFEGRFLYMIIKGSFIYSAYISPTASLNWS